MIRAKLIFLTFVLLFHQAIADFKLRADIEQAFANSSPYAPVSEGLSIDDPEAQQYVLDNWRDIAANIKVLPIALGDIPQKDIAFNVTAVKFFEICQKLPPMEYADLLDEVIRLYKERLISDRTFELVMLAGLEKQDFLSVNYEHPKISKILEEAIQLVPASNQSFKACLEKMASGGLADNYLTNKSVDAKPPETLPGVKLKRPWGSLIRKYERATGKKLPADPNFPDEDQERPVRRTVGDGTSSYQVGISERRGGVFIRWMVGGVVVLCVFFIWYFKWRGRHPG